MKLSDLSDDELVRDLEMLCGEGQRLLARILAHLSEIEERRLDLKAAYPSMFAYCTQRLRMSEGVAFRRITAARLVRRFPELLERIARGEIHLSSLVLLRDHMTEENVDELVTAASGKTKLEVKELLARRAPRPDAPEMIGVLTGAKTLPGVDGPPLANAESVRATCIEPLSAERHMVQLTISTEIRAKLERACDLMRHRNRDGSLEVVMDQALDVLLEKLEKERLGKTARARKSAPRATKKGSIARAVRDEVFARDGEQCTFVAADGRRCAERAMLELDHIEPRARGGGGEAKNLRVTCRSHNLFYAEKIFGKERVRLRQHKSIRRNAETPRSGEESETHRAGTRGLVGMGFRERDARRAVDIVCARHANGALPSIVDLIRESLRLLA